MRLERTGSTSWLSSISAALFLLPLVVSACRWRFALWNRISSLLVIMSHKQLLILEKKALPYKSCPHTKILAWIIKRLVTYMLPAEAFASGIKMESSNQHSWLRDQDELWASKIRINKHVQILWRHGYGFVFWTSVNQAIKSFGRIWSGHPGRLSQTWSPVETASTVESDLHSFTIIYDSCYGSTLYNSCCWVTKLTSYHMKLLLLETFSVSVRSREEYSVWGEIRLWENIS